MTTPYRCAFTLVDENRKVIKTFGASTDFLPSEGEEMHFVSPVTSAKFKGIVLIASHVAVFDTAKYPTDFLAESAYPRTSFVHTFVVKEGGCRT